MRIPTLYALPLDVMPVALIERAASLLFKRLLVSHPGLFDRLGEFRERRFVFAPVDLPLVFKVEPEKKALSVCRKPQDFEADARIEAPLFLLLALLEGRCDADALFFSRDLTVTGDMEAMLAMRNALDDSNIDLPRDLSLMTGPLAPLFARAGNSLRRRALGEETAAWN